MSKKSTTSIKEEFDKVALYKLKTQDNLNLIQAKSMMLNSRKLSISKDPFVYLKEVDEMDVIKKQIANLQSANETMKDELNELPNTIRRKLCQSIRRHFAILEHNRRVEQKKKQQFREKGVRLIKLGSIFSGLVVLSFIARKVALSRK